jgi:predicted ester cyclase
MSTEENKAVVRRFNELIGEFFRTGDADALDEVLSPAFVYHQPGTPPDLESFKQFLPMFRAAFPDMSYTVEDQIAEGDKVVSRYTGRGTHQGELTGIAPTGRQVEVPAMNILPPGERQDS